MNRCLVTLVLTSGLTLVAACAAPSAQAQMKPPVVGFAKKGNKSDSTSAAKAEYATLPQGDSITSGGQTYVVLPDVRAVPANPGEEPAGLTVLERKGRFVVYKETRPQLKSPSALSAQDAGFGSGLAGQPLLSHAVVLNQRTGRVGVVIGTILVKLADMSQAEAIGAAQGLTVSSRFDHLNLAFYTAAPGQDLAAATAALRADPRVTSADPEILENVRKPN